MTKYITTGLVLAAALAVGGTAGAQPTPASLACASSLLKVQGKDAGAKLKCYAKPATTGGAVDPLCLTKANDKSVLGYDKAIAKGGCATDAGTDGEATARLAEIDAYATDVNAALVPTPTASKCASKKLGAAGKLAAALLNCESKAAKKNTPVDQVKCVQKSIDKMLAAFTKEETKAGNDCLTTGDGPAEAARAQQLTELGVTFSPRFDGCGNKFTIAPETCDDGNSNNFDNCPSDCSIDFCNPLVGVTRQVTITASTADIAAIELDLDYPEGKISLPGSGTALPPGTVVPGGSAVVETNDFDHALTLVSFDLFNFGTTSVAVAQFEDCSGAIAPVPGDFSCTVRVASDENLVAVPGVTCAVTIP